jgi:hypothetical protein
MELGGLPDTEEWTHKTIDIHYSHNTSFHLCDNLERQVGLYKWKNRWRKDKKFNQGHTTVMGGECRQVWWGSMALHAMWSPGSASPAQDISLFCGNCSRQDDLWG